MATKLDFNEEESFIILGSSPGTSLDIKCNGAAGSDVDSPLRKAEMEEAMKDLSTEANLAFKAHFKLGDCPSPSSMMAASTIVVDTKSTEELQKSFGEILDENVVLKETLKQNNESLKEQFLLIASCQSDMLKTHKMHQEKFLETKELVERLRQENKKLKRDLTHLLANPTSPPSIQLNGQADSLTKSVTQTDKSPDKSPDSSVDQPDGVKSGPPSTIEFVTSPDDDTIDKLTAQLELVEKQRRQVIVDNEKLLWQKESLERIVDATTKERDEVKEKLKKIELHYSAKETEYQSEIRNLRYAVDALQKELQVAGSIKGLSTEEVTKRDVTIQELGHKVTSLQNELKSAQLKILELESVKMEFTRQKAGASEMAKLHKEQLNDLHNRLKEAQTTVFQPIRFSISDDSSLTSPEYSSFVANVKLYDRALKHLADLLNSMTHCTSDNLLDTLGLVSSLHEFKLDRGSADRVKSGLNEIKLLLEKQHGAALGSVGQIKSTLTIFEGIFQDFKELLKKGLTHQEPPAPSQATKANVDALTAALMARGKELEEAKEEIGELQSKVMALHEDKEDKELLKAQIEVYKSDFEAERESREKMAGEIATLAADLRGEKKRSQELKDLLEHVREVNPTVYTAVTKKKRPLTATTARPVAAAAGTKPATSAAVVSKPATSATTGNMVYKCPKCLRFSSDQYKVMEDHFDYCLDDF